MLNFGARRKTCFLDGRQTAHFFLHGRTRGNCTVNFDGTRCSSRTESKRLYFFCNLAGCFFRFSKLVNSKLEAWRPAWVTRHAADCGPAGPQAGVGVFQLRSTTMRLGEDGVSRRTLNCGLATFSCNRHDAPSKMRGVIGRHMMWLASHKSRSPNYWEVDFYIMKDVP